MLFCVSYEEQVRAAEAARSRMPRTPPSKRRVPPAVDNVTTTVSPTGPLFQIGYSDNQQSGILRVIDADSRSAVLGAIASCRINFAYLAYVK